MIITIVEYPNAGVIGHSPNMFITRDDTAQVSQYVNFNLHVKAKAQIAAHENQLMQLLAPYYTDGWKLVSSSVSDVPAISNNVTETSRYFLTKDQ